PRLKCRKKWQLTPKPLPRKRKRSAGSIRNAVQKNPNNRTAAIAHMKSLPCVIAAAALLLAVSAHAETPSHNAQPFGVWLGEFKQEARSKGIAQETLDEAFADTQPLDGVIELDRKQPESTQTFERYLSRAV